MLTRLRGQQPLPMGSLRRNETTITGIEISHAGAHDRPQQESLEPENQGAAKVWQHQGSPCASRSAEELAGP